MKEMSNIARNDIPAVAGCIRVRKYFIESFGICNGLFQCMLSND